MDEGGDCYKTYQIYEGDEIFAPANPQKEGFLFVGWI